MKRRERITIPAVGGSTLLVIFAVLCLVVFALLSVSTVQAEKRMADAAAQAVTDYYAADLQAQEVFARLRAGEEISGVRENDGVYSFSCLVSDNQWLEVELKKTDDTWDVLRWQVIARAEPVSEVLPVWDGT